VYGGGFAFRKNALYTLLPTGAKNTTKVRCEVQTFFFSFCAMANINLKN